MKKTLVLSIILFGLASNVQLVSAADMATADNYLPSLITATPFEGRQLAIKLSRKSIGEMQSAKEVKHKLRPIYSEDPAMLINAAQVIAIEFQTIAAANNYWRK